MALRSNSFLIIVILLFACHCFSQNDTLAKRDTSFKKSYSSLKVKDLPLEVAKAQINVLKKEGAILVRLKTNSKTIKKLREVGNADLATQIEKETFLCNQIIVDAFLKELTFCPVYFFYSDYSDSIRHKNLQGIFVDTNLVTNPNVICNHSFYLVAEYGGFYNSSLGILNEAEAMTANESGNYVKEAQIILKNRYFFQLHKPFPYTQLKSSSPEHFQKNRKGILKDEIATYTYLKRITNNSQESTKMKNYRGYVNAFNTKLVEFYNQHKDYNPSKEVMEFVY